MAKNTGVKSNLPYLIWAFMMVLIVCIVFIVVFNCGYYLRYFLGNNEVKEVISFNLDVSDSSPRFTKTNNVYLNEFQFEIIRGILEKNDQNNLTVSTLSDFYAALFTAIAVILAIIAMISWLSLRKKMEQMKYAIEEYSSLEEDVKFLRKKKEFADWVRKKFTNEDIEASFDLNLTEEDVADIEEHLEHFKKLQENDTLEGMIIAKYYLLKNKMKIDEAERVYQFLETMTVLPEDSDVKALLYRLLGQFYKVKYDDYKTRGINSYETAERILHKSEEYYKNSLNLKDEPTRANGNLAVLYIEMGKLKLRRFLALGNAKDKEIAHLYFNMAQEKLKGQEGFNKYWDEARIFFYCSDMQKKEQVKELLYCAVNKINSRREGQAFIHKLRTEIKEFSLYAKVGFPGDEVLIDSLERKLKDKLL